MHQIYELKSEESQCSVVKHRPRGITSNPVLTIKYLQYPGRRGIIMVCKKVKRSGE